ncbi:MAG: hypothetical protein LC713_03455, partial [Actinobacteria bacterium]|nr:hypothetical protein [Actinomycetota bacterium]
LTEGRRGAKAVVLADGRVLVAGGLAGSRVLSSTEIYNPATGQWTPTGSMGVPRLGHSLAVLADGRVLATGGISEDPGAEGVSAVAPQASSEIFDPASGSWGAGPAMISERFGHTATALPDGRVLVVGGLGRGTGSPAVLATTELFDPAAAVFVRAGNLNQARTDHAAVSGPDGSVMVVGGAGGPDGDYALASAERLDPRRGTWAKVASLAEARGGASLTLLADDRVLVEGGDAMSPGTRRSLASAEIFDPKDQRWLPAGAMTCPRSEQVAVRLDDRTVLVVGGDTLLPGSPPLAQSCANRFEL